MRKIESRELRPVDIPGDAASIDELIEFAHTFDGYAHWGSFERCGEVARARDLTSLDSARTCLFFEARRWRHFGTDPDAEAMAYWRTILSEIRSLVHRQAQ